MNGFLTTNASRFVILGRIANPAELAASLQLVRSLDILHFKICFTLWNSFQIPQGEFVF